MISRSQGQIQGHGGHFRFYAFSWISPTVLIGEWLFSSVKYSNGSVGHLVPCSTWYWVIYYWSTLAKRRRSHIPRCACSSSFLNSVNLEYSETFFILFQRSDARKWGWAVCVSQCCIHESVPHIPAKPIHAALQGSGVNQRSWLMGQMPGASILQEAPPSPLCPMLRAHLKLPHSSTG